MPARTPHTVTQPARSDSRCAALSASSPQPSHTPTASMIATAIRPALQRSACKTARNPRCGRWPRRSAAQSAARAIARDRPATAHWPAMTARPPQPLPSGRRTRSRTVPARTRRRPGAASVAPDASAARRWQNSSAAPAPRRSRVNVTAADSLSGRGYSAAVVGRDASCTHNDPASSAPASGAAR